MDIRDIKNRERMFREKDLPFGVFTVSRKTRWWNDIELSNVLRYLDVKDGDRVLDVGCSDGRFLEYLHAKCPACGLYGIDFARNPLIELLKKRIGSYAVCGDISDMPFAPGSFDRAVAIQVVQQIPSKEERGKVLRNINVVLKEKGSFVLTVLNRRTWSHLVENGKEGPLVTARDLYVYLYDTQDLADELERAGFLVKEMRGINSLPGRYINNLRGMSVPLDAVITMFFKPLSMEKGSYLLARCVKK